MLHSIDQICARRPSFNISSLSVHRFIIASITILSKAFCDAFSPNPLFAKVGGVSLIELNLLEREFLSAMDWRLAVCLHLSVTLSSLLSQTCICRYLRLTNVLSFPALYIVRPRACLFNWQCTREVLHAYYVKLARTHSSGRYVVPDSSPRPAPIDTLPSDQIEWNDLNGSSESLPASRRRRNAQSASDMELSQSTPMDEGNDSDSSSDGEGGESSAMATDILPSRRFPSRGQSTTSSPVAIGQNPRRAPIQASSSATVEQNVAFMEMRSHAGRSLLAPSTTGVDPSTSRRPLHTFRSPVVGRRRRRGSDDEDDDPRVANTNAFLAMNPALRHPVDVGDSGAVEGLLRGNRRRRLHLNGSDRDRRMEIEPGTPV
jgi:hypothetical protein